MYGFHSTLMGGAFEEAECSKEAMAAFNFFWPT